MPIQLPLRRLGKVLQKKKQRKNQTIDRKTRTASAFGLLTYLGPAVTAWAFGVEAVFFFSTPVDHPNPQAGAEFGVGGGIGDVNGDGVPDLVASAFGQEIGGNAAQGQAYVFSGADLSLLFTLDTPNPQPDAGFGSVAPAGDVNLDGVPDIIVGASGVEVDGLAGVGQAYVFSGATGMVLYTIDNPDPQPHDFGFGIFGGFFGGGVAGIQDVNGDAYPDFAVAASAHLGLGAVYVFSGLDGSLLHTLHNPLPSSVSNFGRVLTGVRDVSGDGIPDLMIGTPGRAFLYSGDGTLLLTIENPDPGFFNVFGLSIAPAGDIDGDGLGDLIIGDFAGGGELIFLPNGDIDLEAWAPGQVFVLSGLDGSLLLAIKNPNPGIFPSFGETVASAGDVSEDGVPDLWVGATEATVGEITRQGRAYLFGGADGRLLLTIDSPDPQPFGIFGLVAPAGDINGDGMPDLWVGAPRQDAGGNSDQGQAYLFLSGDFDIKPGSDANVIEFDHDDCDDDDDSRLKVAILTGGDFDATQVDTSTVRIGDPALSGTNAPIRSKTKDTDGDGDADLLLKFSVCDLITSDALNADTTGLVLAGRTFAGSRITGSDSVRVVRDDDDDGDDDD